MEGCKNCYAGISLRAERLAYRVKKLLGKGFHSWGSFVGSYPVAVILLTILFSIACGVGLMKVYIVADPEKLWVSKDSVYKEQKEYYDDRFGGFYRLNFVLMLPNNDGDEALNKDILTEMFFMYETVRNITIEDPDDSDVILGYDDICAHVYDNSPCLGNTALDYWDQSLLKIQTDTDLYKTVSNAGKRTPYGALVDRKQVMKADIENDVVVKVYAFLNSFLLNNTKNDQIDMKKKSYAWEKEYIKVLEDYSKTTQYATVLYQAERSVGDILAAEIAADTIYVFISYALMFVYCVLTLGRFDWVESKIWVGLVAIFLEILAIIVALGITSAGNVPLSPITLQVLPFLVLGVGINDVFVVTGIFVQTPVDVTQESPAAAQRKRLAEALQHIGPSVLLTSSTNVFVFLVGASTVMPSIRDFCFQAAFSIAMAFVMLMTIFAGILVIDGRRAQTGRVEFFFCFTRSVSESEKEEVITLTDEHAVSIDRRDYLRRLLVKYYLPFLGNRNVKIAVLILTVLLVVWGAYGCGRIEKGLGIRDVVPTGSYVDLFLDKQQKYFGQVGAPVYFVMKDDADYTDYAVQDAIARLGSDLKSNNWFVTPLLSWLDTYLFWVPSFGGHSADLVDGRIPPQNFTGWLKDFLKDPQWGIYYNYDIIWYNETTIKASRIVLNSAGLKTTDDYTNAITAAFDLADSVTECDVYPYSFFYIFFEQYLIIGHEAIRGILVSLAVIFCVSYLSIMHAGASGIVVMTIGLLEIDIAGIMWYWGIDLNAVTAVNLVMAVGIGVSFTTYIAMNFMESRQNTRQSRTDESMSNVGIGIWHGAIALIIGTFLLALARYNLFRVYYFRMYIAIAFLGVWYSFFFLPVILSLIGPSYSENLLKRLGEDLQDTIELTNHLQSSKEKVNVPNKQ